MLNNIELKELHDEYFSISDKIRELQRRQTEIDNTINNNSKEVVASRFIPLEFGDKIHLTVKTFIPWNAEYSISEGEGFFGSWVLDGHQYTVDHGEGAVKIRIYDIKKDGTRSQKCKEIYAQSIVSIEKVEG